MRHCIHQWLIQSVPDGTITKVWQPFTTNMNTREVSGINDVLPKLWLDFCQRIIGFLTLTRLNICVACCNEALYSTNDWYSRPDGTITKVWQPFTTNMYTREVSGINDVLPKLWLDFCIEDHWISHPYKTQYLCGMLQWGTVFHQWLIQQCQMGPLPRSDNPSQPTWTLGRCQASMMCCQSCG